MATTAALSPPPPPSMPAVLASPPSPAPAAPPAPASSPPGTSGVDSVLLHRALTSQPAAPTPAAPRRWTKAEDALLREAVQQHEGKGWKLIASHVKTRSHVQCLQRWKKVLCPGLVKGHWTEKEDKILTSMVVDGEKKQWGRVAAAIDGRTAKQCRERYYNYLDPSIKRGAWSPDEDKVLLSQLEKIGRKWSAISKLIPGRSENAVKTRFKSLARAKARAWSAADDTTLLQTHRASGGSWAEINKALPKRSTHAAKKRWRHLQHERRQEEAEQAAAAAADHAPLTSLEAACCAVSPQHNQRHTATILAGLATSGSGKLKKRKRFVGVVLNADAAPAPPPTSSPRKRVCAAAGGVV